MDELKIKVYDGQITKNFNIDEFACSANGEVLLNADTVAHIQRLQKLRTWFAQPMTVNSGYRTLAYNRTLSDSSDTSQHVLGLATDIHMPLNLRTSAQYNALKAKWYEICAADGIGGGVGFYKTFMHFDSRKNRAFWDMR